jgi:ribosomal protein S18 acetylase RimI-like enzyme
MTVGQYAEYRVGAETHYAESVAGSGSMSLENARQKAADDFARLLPDGLATEGHELFTVYDGDDPVGMLWLHFERKPDGEHAFGYDFSVREDLRRHGYGRAVMVAAERLCRDRGVLSVGLNVFGNNTGARALYEQMGYEPTSIQMRKWLSP